MLRTDDNAHALKASVDKIELVDLHFFVLSADTLPYVGCQV